MKLRQYSCVAIALTGLVCNKVAAADDPVTMSSAPLCGLYCVISCAAALGIEADIQELASSRYLSESAGSSPAEIVAACRQFGLVGNCYRKLSITQLLQIDAPCILHLRSSTGGVGHWIVYLGREGDSIRVFDSLAGIQNYPPGFAIRQWDGIAVVVSRIDEPSPSPHVVPIPPSVPGIPLLACLCAAWGSKKTSEQSRPQLRAASLIVVGVLLSTAYYHFVFSWGFGTNREAVAETTLPHFPEKLSTIDRALLIELIDRPECQLIDARTDTAYARGHIEGAHNIPANSDEWQMNQALNQLSQQPDSFFVVYCQSEHCGWGRRIGTRLKHQGFAVYDYSAGFTDWRRNQ